MTRLAPLALAFALAACGSDDPAPADAAPEATASQAADDAPADAARTYTATPAERDAVTQRLAALCEPVLRATAGGLGIPFTPPESPDYCATEAHGQPGGVGAYFSVASGSETVCGRIYENDMAVDVASGRGLVIPFEGVPAGDATSGSGSFCDAEGFRYDLEISGTAPPGGLVREVMELAITS